MDPAATQKQYRGNGNLGFEDLSKIHAPASLLQGYERLGLLEPDEFLAKWRDVGWKWSNSANNGQGFLASDKQPNKFVLHLGPGTLIDRFGKDDTEYFAPFATPYAMRSLPPDILWLPYTVYRVMRPLRVTCGPIAPGFEQRGLGTQYIADAHVDKLLEQGYVEKISEHRVHELYGSWDRQQYHLP